MAVEHVNITDPELHEPKGVAAASADTVYVANGSGSGTWQKVDADSFDSTGLMTDIQSDLDDGTLEVTGRFFITMVIEDVSTASSVIVPLIRDCTVIGASVVLGGPITVADAKISFKNSAAASMGTDVTIAYTSSAKGDQYAFTSSANNVITGPSWIEIATDGGSTDAQPVYVTVELEYIANG
jgi:hypothetical protein